MSIRLPSSLGSLWVVSQAAPGAYLAPALTGPPPDPAVSLIKSGPTPEIAGQGILRNESDVTPIGGGGEPALGDLMMGWGTVEISASALHVDTGVASADWLPLLRCCVLEETGAFPGMAGDGTVRFRPSATYEIKTGNDGSPIVASWTWRDAGVASVAQVWRSQDCVARLAGVSSGADGDVRLAFEAMGLWYRDTDVADAVTTASRASLTAAATYVDRAEHPLFRLAGVAWSVDGGTPDTAQFLGDVCVHEFAFDPAMSLEPQSCLQEVDGYAPAFSATTGQPVLSVTVSVPEEDGTDEAVIAAMLRELAGASCSLTWTRVSSGVTWTLKLELLRFRVLSVTRGDAQGARTYQVEIAGRPNSAGTEPGWSLTWTRSEA